MKTNEELLQQAKDQAAKDVWHYDGKEVHFNSWEALMSYSLYMPALERNKFIEERLSAAALLAIQSAREEGMQWIPVADRLPELSGRVLVLFEEFGINGHYSCVGTYWHLRNEWTVDNEDYLSFSISHWMTMPKLTAPGR